jgi:hypothetical protein
MEYSQLVEFKSSANLKEELNLFLNGGDEQDDFQTGFNNNPVNDELDAPYTQVATPKKEEASSSSEDIDALLKMI